MNSMDKVKELMDQISEILKEKYPKHTACSLTVDPDGYRHIAVKAEDKMDKNTYRVLFLQSNVGGIWRTEWSNDYNNFLAQEGKLLREGK